MVKHGEKKFPQCHDYNLQTISPNEITALEYKKMTNIERSRRQIKIIKYAFLLSGILILAFVCISLPANTPEIQNHSDNILDNKIHSEKAEKKDYQLKISKSIFEGLSSDLLPYKVIAKTATKINDNLYDLQNIDAQYLLENGSLKIKAIDGIFNDEAKSIILQNNVQINYGGAEINSEKIQFDLHNKNAQSDSKVHVKYKNSSLDADRFDTDDSSNIINLEGNVESLFKISDF